MNVNGELSELLPLFTFDFRVLTFTGVLSGRNHWLACGMDVVHVDHSRGPSRDSPSDAGSGDTSRGGTQGWVEASTQHGSIHAELQ